MTTIRFYRIYDAGMAVNLDELEEAFAEKYITSRARFRRIHPKSIVMDKPPLVLNMGQITVEAGGKTYEMSMSVKILDIGVISICIICYLGESDPAVLYETALSFGGKDCLSDHFYTTLKTLDEIFSIYIRDFVIEEDFYEDYTIYTVEKETDAPDPVSLFLCDGTDFSDQFRDETLRNVLSYSRNDKVIISWDGALIISPESPDDIIDLIEYANVQVFEFRYYDRELTNRIENMYDDIEDADRMYWFWRMYRYHGIMVVTMEIYADLYEIIERVNNLIKVTEDVYYARVYETALKEFRIGQWSGSVTRKIDVLRENYSMLSDEVRIQHSYFLEWIVILLIGFEFLFAVWQYFI
ncbi:hypothetical protein [Methanolacinia petrolearia]|uniref:hypothetical protein n=1 Tax=Methanolacinia petrolearia TaxID=54120 RepID=UPI003BAD67D7